MLHEEFLEEENRDNGFVYKEIGDPATNRTNATKGADKANGTNKADRALRHSPEFAIRLGVAHDTTS